MKKGAIFVLLLLVLSISVNAQIYPLKCYDGIKNGDETGTDCGGSCKPCGVSVTQIIEENTTLLYVAIGGLIVIFIFALIAIFWSSRKKKKTEEELEKPAQLEVPS